MKISILSLFRDSEPVLASSLANLEKLEEITGFDFRYVFYENDSTDNTVDILNDWLQSRKGKLVSETLDAPKFGQVSDADRMRYMTMYRNKLLEAAMPLFTDFTLLYDSDVDFQSNLLSQYLEYFDALPHAAMLTPNIRQNIPCIMGSTDPDSYYDSWALIDSRGQPGMTWASCPFYSPIDRDSWNNSRPVRVNSAFGGIPIVRTDLLEMCKWSTRGGCEHWQFCQDIRQWGEIYVVPEIRVNVTIKRDTIDSLEETMKQVAERQKHHAKESNHY